jgi:hypothetical protein
MIVSDEHKFLFFSIPRTGSGTLQNKLVNFGWRSGNAAPDNHLTAEQMKAHPAIGNRKFRDYRNVCFVRNPWDRYVSLFLWINNHHRRTGQPLYDGLGGYIKSGGLEGQHQHEFLHNANGRYIIDFAGRFETYEESIRNLLEFLGLPLSFSEGLCNANPNNNKGRVHYSEYYTEQWMIDAVAEREHKMIERFGYKFGEDGRKIF